MMLFYTVGERLQLLAVNKASKNISDLLDVRPERTDVWRTGTYMNVSPKDVKVGERIEVKPADVCLWMAFYWKPRHSSILRH